MSNKGQTPTALDVPACSGRPWTEADVAELLHLYEDGGDKACLPMRIIAKRIGRSEAAAWAKLRRACPNTGDVARPAADKLSP